MQLYLLRHAHALDGDDDAARPLSKKGREQIDALADFLRGKELFAPTEIWHSPLVRAHETASRLARKLELTKTPLVETGGLLPEDDVRRIAATLKTACDSLALVGHEPHLSALASLLVTGVAEPPAFVFKKGTLLALDRIVSGWAVRWQVSPELLP
ncbi:MAG TPA: phosphohistidine phosphatase SixA [Opitutaceae bacterium]|nr:phosphohistidine phosphatase SixA [Opitutaceae bacterium]